MDNIQKDKLPLIAMISYRELVELCILMELIEEAFSYDTAGNRALRKYGNLKKSYQ